MSDIQELYNEEKRCIENDYKMGYIDIDDRDHELDLLDERIDELCRNNPYIRPEDRLVA